MSVCSKSKQTATAQMTEQSDLTPAGEQQCDNQDDILEDLLTYSFTHRAEDAEVDLGYKFDVIESEKSTEDERSLERVQEAGEGECEDEIEGEIIYEEDSRIIEEDLTQLEGKRSSYLGKEELLVYLKELADVEEFDRYHLAIFLFALFILSLVLTIPFMIVTISDVEIGVGYNPLFARFDDELYDTGGVHMKSWGGYVRMWPKTDHIMNFFISDAVIARSEKRFVEHRDEIECNSKDGLKMTLELSIHYRPNPKHLKYLTKRYRSVDSWKHALGRQVDATVHHVCGAYTAEEFQSQHNLFINQLEEEIIDSLSKKYRSITSRVNIYGIHRPVEFENSIKDKENARSEVELARSEEAEKLTSARTRLHFAGFERQRILNTAETDSQIVLAQAQTEASTILHRVEGLQAYMTKVKAANQLDEEEMLNFLKSDVFSSDITIAVNLPQDVTFKDEL